MTEKIECYEDVIEQLVDRCLFLQRICDGQDMVIDDLRTKLSVANRRLADRERRLEIMEIELNNATKSLKRIQTLLR